MYKPTSPSNGYNLFDWIKPYPTDVIGFDDGSWLTIHTDDRMPLGEIWFIYPVPGQTIDIQNPLTYQKVMVALVDVPQDSAQDVDASPTCESPGHA